MNILKFVLRLLGWLVTILLQVALSFLIIFKFSVFFPGADSTSRLAWLALLFVIWLGYVAGINLVGWVALRWVWRDMPLLIRKRLLGTVIGAAIPLVILLPIGFSVPVGTGGTRFFDLVTNNWQPILAQASLFAAIIGYYLPGILQVRPKNYEKAHV